MIKNIIFDIGQVLAHFRWRESIKELGFSEEINERIGKATVLSANWHEIDRGVLPTDEILSNCIALDPEIEHKIRAFFNHRERMVVEYDYSKDWVCGLKERGYHVYILSNYGKDSFAYVKDKFEFLRYVDGMIISYQEKCIKPNPQIYQILLQRYGLNAKECVFIDDLPENIDQAKQFGMQGIVFTSITQAKQELEDLLTH